MNDLERIKAMRARRRDKPGTTAIASALLAARLKVEELGTSRPLRDPQ